MKNKILIGSSLIVLIALICIAIAPSATGQAGADKACDERLLNVLNPSISTKMVARVPLAPRADTLEGKTIYMVDLQWGGPEAAYSVFEEMQGWFARNMPSVKTEVRRSKGGWMGGDDPELRKEIIGKKAAGVIVGIGG
jgi:hypothetical protein